MNDATLNKYNTAAHICGAVFKTIKNKIIKDNVVNILELNDFGNKKIIEAVSLTYKTEKNKGIASPVSISLNNCLGNYIYEESLQTYNTIESGDVVKIDFSVSIGGCIASIGETFVYGENNTKHNDVIKLLDKVSSKILKKIQHEETNDEIRMYIESKCANKNVFPVSNCISYQHSESHCKTSDSKYIILNYKPIWDTNDTLVNEENLCFEFEEGEVYTINISVIENDDQNTDCKYIQLCNPHLYRFNDCHYNLKLKSSRSFLSKVKSEHHNYSFPISKYNTDPKNKMGMRECLENGILERLPILFTNDNNKVFSKKFTIVVKKNSAYLLKYDL